jgi:hypothetical protein
VPRCAYARQPPLDLALELLDHALGRHAGRQRRAHHRRLLGAVEPLEQRQQPAEALVARRRERVLGVDWEG